MGRIEIILAGANSKRNGKTSQKEKAQLTQESHQLFKVAPKPDTCNVDRRKAAQQVGHGEYRGNQKGEGTDRDALPQ